MDKAYFVQLYDYNAWANRKVWDCIAQLTEEQFNQELGYSVGSIWRQMFHMMAVESWWFHFLATGEVVVPEWQQFTTRAAIQAEWEKAQAQARRYLETLTAEELQRQVKPPFWEDASAIYVSEALAHIVNHSTDHRAQVLAGLHQLEAPTVAQDYLFYLFEKQGVKT